MIWVHNQQYKLHGNGLFYNIETDREELPPLPHESLNDEQQAILKEFQAAIKSMPKTNPAYKDRK